jgi:PAS domain S-box-containing protein
MIRGFADIIPIAVYEMDLEYCLTFVNDHGYRWFGISREDMEKKVPILQFVTPDERDLVVTYLKSVISGSGDTGHEYHMVLRDGTTAPVLMYGAKIINPETGEPSGIRGVIIDLTDRKKETPDLHENKE